MSGDEGDPAVLSECGHATGLMASADGVGVSIHVDGLDPADAHALLGALVGLNARMAPASQRELQALEAPLRAINEARGTAHTLESVAAVCRVDLGEAMRADVTRMAVYIGGTLMAR